jgi:hypothetical protein
MFDGKWHQQLIVKQVIILVGNLYETLWSEFSSVYWNLLCSLQIIEIPSETLSPVAAAIAECQQWNRIWTKTVSRVVRVLNNEFSDDNNMLMYCHDVNVYHVIKSCSYEWNQTSVAWLRKGQNYFITVAVPLDNCLFTPFICQICLLSGPHFYFVHMHTPFMSQTLPGI